jgi:hypothetical protein
VDRLPVSYRDTADWRQSSRTLCGIGLSLGYTAVLEAGGEPVDVSASKIDAELLGVLGVAPALGRPFSAREVARRLVTACLAAGYLPARRASRTDPASILRSL